jgi:hypothetical protein
MDGIMVRKTISFTVICLLGISILTSCGENEKESDKSWNVFKEAVEQDGENHPREVSVSDLKELFSNKSELMISLVRMCEDNPAIRRVGINDDAVSFYGKGHTSSDFMQVAGKTKSTLFELSASSVECGRRGDFDGNPLAVVSFVMYASGLSVSGSSLGIIYRTEWSRKNNPITKQNIESMGYTELAKEGWYVFENDDQRVSQLDNQ